MADQDCIDFLRWCLPRMQYRWEGFRKVRKQVCKRVHRRCFELRLSDIFTYWRYVEENKDEWGVLDSLCNITISRFYRDRDVFDTIQNELYLQLVGYSNKHNENELRCWSVGCCSGEEPYTLMILWNYRILPGLKEKCLFQIIATDREEKLIERARRGIYPPGSLKDLPGSFIDKAFIPLDCGYKINEELKTNIEFVEQDIREGMPDGKFHIILCRNLVFTYFQKDLQQKILNKLVDKLRPAGYLIIGAHESLPERGENHGVYEKARSIYQKMIIT